MNANESVQDPSVAETINAAVLRRTHLRLALRDGDSVLLLPCFVQEKDGESSASWRVIGLSVNEPDGKREFAGAAIGDILTAEPVPPNAVPPDPEEESAAGWQFVYQRSNGQCLGFKAGDLIRLGRDLGVIRFRYGEGWTERSMPAGTVLRVSEQDESAMGFLRCHDDSGSPVRIKDPESVAEWLLRVEE